MRYARRRRKSRRRFYTVTFVLLALVATGTWYFWPRGSAPVETGTPITLAGHDETPPDDAEGVRLVAHEQVVRPNEPSDEPEPTPSVAVQQVAPVPAPEPASERESTELAAVDDTTGRVNHDTRTGNEAIERGRKLIEQGKLLAARQHLNNVLSRNLSETEAREVRALLTRMAKQTIFSRGSFSGDPLVDDYSIQSGDRLIRIGRRFAVPHEIIQRINEISDPARIRVGQRIKVPRGPFHARIDKSEFRLDVYLSDTYVRSFPVGLGRENGTPEGTWKVKERLANPTYYPPASAPDKRIIPPGDPENPLGERWIGLEGVSGQAEGREGYGIHGTIEPESIGRAVSLGCVRMHNDDVAFLYSLLQPGKSTVTIVP